MRSDQAFANICWYTLLADFRNSTGSYVKESSNNDSSAPSYSKLRAAAGLFCVAVLAIFALLIVLGVVIETTEHNGAGYVMALFSLVVALLAALGLSRCYRDLLSLFGKTHWLAARRTSAERNDERSRRAPPKERERARRATPSPAQAKAARHEPAVWSAPRERFVTAKGEEPYIGASASDADDDVDVPVSTPPAQHDARSVDKSEREPSLGKVAADIEQEGPDESLAAPISAELPDEPSMPEMTLTATRHEVAPWVETNKASDEDDVTDWVQIVSEDEDTLPHSLHPFDEVTAPAPEEELPAPSAVREKPRIRVVAGGKVGE